MILTEQQNTAIVEYLISKGLSFDLLPEIHDHFATQIVDYTAQGNTFEQAFELVKEDWKNELKSVQLHWLSILHEVPSIVSKTNRRITTQFWKKSFLYSLPFLLLSLIIKPLNKDISPFFFVSILVIAVLPLVYYQIKYWTIFKLQSKLTNSKKNFSVFRDPTVLFLLLTCVFKPEHLNFIQNDFFEDVIFSFWIYLVLVSSLFIVFTYRKIVNSYNQMEPYLQYMTD